LSASIFTTVTNVISLRDFVFQNAVLKPAAWLALTFVNCVWA